MTAAKKKAAPAKPPAGPEKNPLVGQVTRVRPDGMPPLWPLHAMPRRERAAALRQTEKLSEGFMSLQEGVQPNDDGEIELDLSKLGVMADFTDLCADIADFLVDCSAPQEKDAMRTWVDGVPDAELAGAFSYYMATMQPGEAESS